MNRPLLLAALALLLILAGALILFARPSPSARQAAPITAAPAAPDAGAGPANSFIVCPGNPRCPKAEDGQDNQKQGY